MLGVFIVMLFTSCVSRPSAKEILLPKTNLTVNDITFIKNNSFPKGDARRYGVYPNQQVSQKNLSNMIVLATEGLPITFPKGSYKTNIVLSGVSDINFIFQGAIISGAISILDGSNKLKFDGELTVLDKLFIRKSNNITFETIVLKSDTLANLYNKKNRGVSIYAGSKNISFKSLEIHGTGGGSHSFYKHTAAALQIHGWNNNPEYVYIHKLKINNAARTALYITGSGHKIEKASITNFGQGSAKNMFGLEDAKPGTEKEFTGAWLNKCNNVIIDSLEISQNYRKGTNSIRLDEGKYHEPTFINHIKLSGYTEQLNIADHKLTNILVKDEYE